MSRRRAMDVTGDNDTDLSRRALTKQLVGAGVVGLSGLVACDQPDATSALTTRELQGSASSLWFDTYTELRAVKGGGTTTSANVAVGRAANIGGVFVWTTDTTSADNKGTIIVPTGTRTGCWKRIFEGTLDVKWFGATGDGTTDDSTAIRDALAALPAGGGTVFFPAGTYRVSRQATNNWCLKIPVNNVTITGAGLDVSTINLLNGQAASAHVLFADARTKISIQDLSIDGNKSNQTNQQHGIALNACSDTTISRIAVRNTSGSNINGTGTIVRTVVNDSRFAAAGLPSIAFQGFNELAITGSHFSGITASNTHIQQTTATTGASATITANTFLGDATCFGVWFRGGSLAALSSTISVANNVFSGLYQAVVIGPYVQGLAVSGNVVESCKIAAANSNYLAGYGYTANSNISITGNMIRNANGTSTEWAISITNCTGCTISSNVVAGSTGRLAIAVNHVQNFTIAGNSIGITATGASPVGIQAVRAIDGVVSSNVISMPPVASGIGISLFDDATYPTARVLLADNSILGAVGTGIYVAPSGSNPQIGLGENFIPAATNQINGPSDANAAYPQVGRFSVAGQKRTFRTAKPTSPMETWAQGDVVVNTSPSPGTYSGWVCTAGGSPGTWKGYGMVES